jgi:hypothetical protein
MLTLALWGRSVEIMVNQFTNFDANLVKISATLLGDVACRLPAAFTISDPILAQPAP